MDRKAIFRAKLRESEQKKDKRIDSPLVRYNENGQPICKVCNLVLKSEAIWPAHQVSRKHHEAIEKLKAAAEAQKGNSSVNINNNEQKSVEVQKSRPASSLPSNFFDNKDSKKPKTEKNNEQPEFKVPKSRVPANFFDSVKDSEELTESNEKSQPVEPAKELTESKEKSQPVKTEKGALPEGFFDNKDADLKARGIQPVKVDINDAVKEFEKEIQDNLQDVDDRLEEEEIDAAEDQGELLTIEQREYREKVEMVKQKLMEVKAAKLARAKQKPAFETKDSESDSSDDDDESFNVDWRAQHL